MIKTSVLRYAAIGMASMSLAGFAAASTVNFDTTGADSNNHVGVNNKSTVSSTNFNNAGVGNFNAQGANSGDVKATKNTVAGGTVSSGAAMNDNAADTDVQISNSGMNAGLAAFAGMGASDDHVSISKTGADSDNTVKINNSTSVKSVNLNNVQVENVNLQSAQSGNVSANKNTEVGGLSSGAASNTSTTSTSVKINN